MPSSCERPLSVWFAPDELMSPETRSIEARAHAKAVLQRSDGILAASEKLNIRVDHLLAGLSHAILFLAHEEEH